MFSENYPNLAYLFAEHEYQIQLGSDEDDTSMVRIISENELRYEDWESKSLDEALEKAEIWAAEENEE